MPHVSTTEIHAPFDQAYLFKSTAAIDDFLTQVAYQLKLSRLPTKRLAGIIMTRPSYLKYLNDPFKVYDEPKTLS